MIIEPCLAGEQTNAAARETTIVAGPFDLDGQRAFAVDGAADDLAAACLGTAVDSPVSIASLEVKADMPRWQMSDSDLADVFAFLKALPE